MELQEGSRRARHPKNTVQEHLTAAVGHALRKISKV